jgi:hypothetical protein
MVKYEDGAVFPKDRFRVRRFRPFYVHDLVEVDVSGEFDFKPARVVKVQKKQASLSVILVGDESPLTVPRSYIRRECDVVVSNDDETEGRVDTIPVLFQTLSNATKNVKHLGNLLSER